ncbi:BMP family ABC transporter substrate-binding protein [Clostridia bacterium]|nr:BMP family ABC transporter substrate-binding protein [Clostridia bacterium]
MKKRYKIISILLIVVLCAAMSIGCAKSDPAPAPAPADSGSSEAAAPAEPAGDLSDIRVGFVASGMLGDKSFNDNVWSGLQKAEAEFGITIKALESNETADWDSNLVAMAEEGYDLIVTPSQLTETLTRIAGDYPDVKFAIIDAEVDAPNVASLIFAQNEGSFLVGAAAAIFTTAPDIEGVNPENTIGFIGGMDIPVIHDFLKGYEQGAKYVDPDITVLVSYIGTFNDPIKGKEIAEAQYSQGVDITYNLGATAGIGVLEAMEESGKFAIGGDVDEDSKYPGHVLISELKRTDVAAYEMAKAVVEGTFKGGLVAMNLENGGMGTTDMSVMKAALGDKFPEEIITTLADLRTKIMNKEIVVDHEEGFTV